MTNQTTTQPNLDLNNEDLFEPVEPTETTTPQQTSQLQDVSLEEQAADTDAEAVSIADTNAAINFYEQFFTDFQTKEDLRKETLDNIRSITGLGDKTNTLLSELIDLSVKDTSEEEKFQFVYKVEDFLKEMDDKLQSLPIELYVQLYVRQLVTVEEAGDIEKVIHRYDALKMLAANFYFRIVEENPEKTATTNPSMIQEQSVMNLLSGANEVIRLTLADVQAVLSRGDSTDNKFLTLELTMRSKIIELFNYLDTISRFKLTIRSHGYFLNIILMAKVYYTVLAEEAQRLKPDDVLITEADENSYVSVVETAFSNECYKLGVTLPK